MMTALTTKPKRERNRFSLILQLGASKKSNDARSKYLPSPDTNPQPAFMGLSPRGFVRTPASHRDYSELANTASSQATTTVPPTLNELDATEKAKLLKKARKLSRVFGEVAVLDQPISPVDGNRSLNFLDVEHSPNRSNSPFSLSRNGSLKRRSILRLSSQPDISNQNPFVIEMPGDIFSHDYYRASSPSPNDFVDATPSPDPTCVTKPELLLHIITTQVGEADGHSATSIDPTIPFELPRKMKPATPHPDENTLPDWEAGSHRSRSLSIRRQSLDLDVLEAAELSFEEPACVVEDGKGLSRSLSARTKNEARNLDHCVDIDPLITERIRLLKVKRARKMTQLFGHDPPLEMLHNPRAMDRTSIGSSSTESGSSLAFSSVKVPFADPSSSDSLGEVIPTTHDIHLPSFQERRRRAAKLAQFFGIAYHEISSSLAIPEPTVFSARPTPVYVKDDSTLQVDIQISGRSRPWGRNRIREANITDARDRLRALKVA